MDAQEPLLEVRGLVKTFGGVKAVSDLDLTVRTTEIHAIIGPNGSGKTTTLNVISGIYRADAGSILLGRRELRGMPPHAIAAAGVARTFQNIRLFGGLSVRENVMIGRHVRTSTNLLTAVFPNRATAREERETRDRAGELLEFVGLPHAASRPARSLPYGDQRRVEIARALATEPRLLLLDEPAAGMNPAETDDLIGLVERIRRRGITLLLIEHDMNLVMTLCDRITVLNFGTHIAEGAPAQIARNRDVITAYLGGSIDAA
jgi:branched-chain amino acid transport system ATP-binding protein